MKLKSIPEFQISPRVTVQPGSIVRFRGAGGDIAERIRGTFLVKDVLQSGRSNHRVWLDVFGTTGGYRTVFVSGSNYTRLGLKWKPYSVRKAKK